MQVCYDRARKTAVIGVRKALEPVDHGEDDVVDATVLSEFLCEAGYPS